jgi:hypothetical protein
MAGHPAGVRPRSFDMRKKSRKLHSIGPVLDVMFRDLGISERIRLSNLQRRWNDIFSGPLAGHTAPVDLREGMLIVAVDSPAWLQHLKFMKKDILEKLKDPAVKDIKLRHGSIHQKTETSKSILDLEAPVFRKLTAGETESINDAVTEIEDDELKDIVRKALEKSVTRKRA